MNDFDAASNIVALKKLRLVAIPRLVTARQAGDVAFDVDTIGRRDEDRAEDFDCARNDGRRAEQTCRPEPELLRLRPSNRRGMKESSSSGR